MGAERRRSDRYEQVLPVDIHDRRGTRRASTVDVGRHGIFVEMDEPPPDRMLLRLTVHLPDGPIPVLAAVVRRSEDAAQRGVGLQFFAIDEAAKDRWDRHIAGLRGERKLPPEQRSDVRHAATFLVKVRELDRLQELHTRDVSSGGFFLVSPVLRHVGSEVNLVFVHPGTLEEFTVRGAVTRVQTSGIPGMGIRLFHFTDESREAFQSFLETGISAISQRPASALEEPGLEESGEAEPGGEDVAEQVAGLEGAEGVEEPSIEEITVQAGDIESVELDPLEMGGALARDPNDRAWREAEAEKEIAAVRAAQEAAEEFGIELDRLAAEPAPQEPWPAAIDGDAPIEVAPPEPEPDAPPLEQHAAAPEPPPPSAPAPEAPPEPEALPAPAAHRVAEPPAQEALPEPAAHPVAEAPPPLARPTPAEAPASAVRQREAQPRHEEHAAPGDDHAAPRRAAGDLATLASHIDDRPDAIDVRLRLAAKLLEAGRAREALEQAAAAVRLDPRHPIALGSLARALVAMGRPDDAEAALLRARKAGYLGDERLTAEILRLRKAAL